MLHGDWMTTAAIQAIFADEISSVGGSMAEVFDDGECLFARSVLLTGREVLPRDWVQDGVALRMKEGDVCVSPYTFRRICSNGAIMAHVVQSRTLDDLGQFGEQEAEAELRRSIRACCSEDIFLAAASEARTARETSSERALNLMLDLMPLLSRWAGSDHNSVFREIVSRFVKDGDSSRFGLMNAVTSVARDTSDPDLRWRLEELGGGVLADCLPTTSPDGRRATRVRKVDEAIA